MNKGQAMELLRFPNKQIRARVIADYVRRAGWRAVVCFTCGNAAAALRAEGLDVVEIGPRGELVPGRWWQQADIARAFPQHFDATSGHLHAGLMVQIAAAFREHLGDLPGEVYVPSGSGETAVCLAMAYPGTAIHAVYDESDPATAYSPQAPLNKMVELLCRPVWLPRAAA